MTKTADAFRTISEVADDLRVPQHVLRFWETKFAQIRPLKRAGNRRYYRPDEVDLLRAIRKLLHHDGYTIKGVQRILKEQGARAVADLARASQGAIVDGTADEADDAEPWVDEDGAEIAGPSSQRPAMPDRQDLSEPVRQRPVLSSRCRRRVEGRTTLLRLSRRSCRARQHEDHRGWPRSSHDSDRVTLNERRRRASAPHPAVSGDRSDASTTRDAHWATATTAPAATRDARGDSRNGSRSGATRATENRCCAPDAGR